MGLLHNHQMKMVVLYYTILALVEIPFIKIRTGWKRLARNCLLLSSLQEMS